MNKIKDDFQDLLLGQFDDIDDSLAASIEATAIYAAERAAYLATIAGIPDFAQAVEVERNNVALHAGIAAVHEADFIDARVLGAIQGGLFFAAKLAAASL